MRRGFIVVDGVLIEGGKMRRSGARRIYRAGALGRSPAARKRLRRMALPRSSRMSAHRAWDGECRVNGRDSYVLLRIVLCGRLNRKFEALCDCSA
jgi:hypothetical protein